MSEVWKPAPGFDGAYSVSSLGRVRSERSTPGASWVGKIINAAPDKNGYRRFDARVKGVRKYVSVHRLVCEAFNGAPTPESPEVNHKNGDKADNRPENLEWCSRAGNTLHVHRVLGLHRGESVPWAKLTDADVRAIRMDARSNVKVAAAYGVSKETIRQIRHRLKWSHVA